MKIAKLAKILTTRFRKAGIESPELCSRVLLRKASGLSRLEFLLAGNNELSVSQLEDLEQLANRCANGEPLAYILGSREFYSLDFQVSSATLIPRPETELLVDLALEYFPKSRLTFADLGCGSGCIGLTLLNQRPAWHGVLIDNSKDCLAIASANAQALNIKAVFLQADIFSLPLAKNSMELIVSNPPYIGESEKRFVSPATLAYEPHSALFSQEDGFSHIRGVLTAAYYSLIPGGCLLLEHGFQQADNVIDLLNKAGFAKIESFRDLAGLPRAILAWKGGKNG